MKKDKIKLTPEELEQRHDKQQYEAMEKSDSFEKYSPFTTHPVTKSAPYALSGMAQGAVVFLGFIGILALVAVILEKCS